MSIQQLTDALRSGTQADADGVMVKVSRQACEEAAAELEGLVKDRDRLAGAVCAMWRSLKLEKGLEAGRGWSWCFLEAEAAWAESVARSMVAPWWNQAALESTDTNDDSDGEQR